MLWVPGSQDPGSRDPGIRNPGSREPGIPGSGIDQNAENCACLNLDALSVPEALVQSIRILVVPAVALAHALLK